MNKDYQIRIYPRDINFKNQLWEWVVYDLDGFTPLRNGEIRGSESAAMDSAKGALAQIRMDKKMNRGSCS